MSGFPKTIEKSQTLVGDVTFSQAPEKIETFYRIARVPGEIANCAVEELSIQGNKILSRKIVSDRDSRVGAESKLMSFLDRARK